MKLYFYCDLQDPTENHQAERAPWINIIIIIIIIIIIKRLAEKLSEKNEEPYHITITWIRTLLSFEILRSVHTCVRGSRTPFHKIPQGDFIDDCRLNAGEAGVR